MRIWIEHLITHAGAYADFLDYLKGIEDKLNQKMYVDLLNKEEDKAKMAAAELSAYKRIQSSLKMAYNERQSQIDYNENIK